LIKKLNKFEELPEYLKQVAYLRLENPDASLKTLGEMLEKPLGKSGVNHRLQKIHEIAEELRK
jgi:DNA-binding protein WhiA